MVSEIWTMVHIKKSFTDLLVSEKRQIFMQLELKLRQFLPIYMQNPVMPRVL